MITVQRVSGRLGRIIKYDDNVSEQRNIFTLCTDTW